MFTTTQPRDINGPKGVIFLPNFFAPLTAQLVSYARNAAIDFRFQHHTSPLTEATSSACSSISTRAFLYDEEYFNHGEDLRLHLRLRRQISNQVRRLETVQYE